MVQSPAPPAVSWVERLRARTSPRVVGAAAALIAEAILLLLLLSLGDYRHNAKRPETVVDFTAQPESEDPPRPEPTAESKQAAAADQTVQPRPTQAQPPPSVVPPLPMPAPVVPAPRIPTLPVAPAVSSPPAPPAPVTGPVYGPPDSGGGSAGSYGDTARVGTAPNGQPMYAAAWYRKPQDSELRGYLSTASGPGWGLIACKTVPDFRVEDCVGLDEYPEGSQIVRAVLAAAWQFRVRPPRRGGELMVGSWVRIRIDYDIRKE